MLAREMASSEIVKTEIRDGLAILTIDNPPVNALSTGVRRDLSQATENVSKTSKFERCSSPAPGGPSSAVPISAVLESHPAPGSD
jgi:hypothetical protein